MSGRAFNSVSDLGPRDSRDYLLRRRFVKIICFGLGCFNRRVGLGSVDSLAVAGLAVAGLAVAGLAVAGLAVDSLAVVSLAVAGLAVVSLAVADFGFTRGKGGRKTGSRCSADLKLG